MVATITQGTNGEAKLGERQILTAALAAAEAPEISTGRGVNIFHVLETQRFVIVQDYASRIVWRTSALGQEERKHHHFHLMTGGFSPRGET